MLHDVTPFKVAISVHSVASTQSDYLFNPDKSFGLWVIDHAVLRLAYFLDHFRTAIFPLGLSFLSVTNLEAERGKICGNKSRIPSLCMIWGAHYYTKYLYETERKIMTSDFSWQAPENITLCRVVKQVTVSDFSIHCDLTLFCLQIRGEERKTSERASVICACGRKPYPERKSFRFQKYPVSCGRGPYLFIICLTSMWIILGSSGI